MGDFFQFELATLAQGLAVYPSVVTVLQLLDTPTFLV
jgi:hypothetical protein